MNTQVDIYLSFPADADTKQSFDELYRYFGSIEAIEIAFEIEFSCGDSKFLSNDSDFANEEELEKYDGKVCLQSLPQSHILGNLLQANKNYRFTIKYSEISEEEVYYFNGKEIGKKYIG